MRTRRKLTLVAGVLASAAVGAGIAYSSEIVMIPDGNGVIHACYKKPIGPVSIVRSADDCTRYQEPIQWAQSGIPGPKGDPGPEGPPGPQGPSGAGGPPGAYTVDGTKVLVTRGVSETIASLEGLPAGRYVFWATIADTFARVNDTTSHAPIVCRMVVNGIRVHISSPASLILELHDVITDTVGLSVPEDTSFAVDCSLSSGAFDVPTTAHARLTALPVAGP